MTFGLAVWWMLVGWCGTPWPRPWPWPWPPPGPDPDPWLWKAIGTLGGLAGGFAFTQAWGMEGAVTGLAAAATAAGAWAGSVLATNVFGAFRNR